MNMIILLGAAAVREWRSVLLNTLQGRIHGGHIFYEKLIHNVYVYFMQPRDTRYVSLNDGRKLCLECLDSAIMGTNECQPLYLDIQEFYEGLNMKLEQQVPLLLVERQALNEAREGERNVRAYCLQPFV